MLDKSRIKNPGFFGRIIASIFKKKPTSEVWIMNIDEYGDKNWHNTYGGKKKDVGKSIIQSGDGGYIITSETSSKGAGKNDIWLIKVDKNGKIIEDGGHNELVSKRGTYARMWAVQTGQNI